MTGGFSARSKDFPVEQAVGFHLGRSPFHLRKLPFVRMGEGKLLGCWDGSPLFEPPLSHPSILPKLYPVYSLSYPLLLPGELDTFFICLSHSKFGAFSYHMLCLECSLPLAFLTVQVSSC